MDSVIINGFYTIVHATNNAPFSTDGFSLIVVGNNYDHIVQIACSFHSNSMKFRRCNNIIGWDTWKTVSAS